MSYTHTKGIAESIQNYAILIRILAFAFVFILDNFGPSGGLNDCLQENRNVFLLV